MPVRQQTGLTLWVYVADRARDLQYQARIAGASNRVIDPWHHVAMHPSSVYSSAARQPGRDCVCIGVDNEWLLMAVAMVIDV